MKTLALLIFGLALASSAMAGQEPDSPPAPAPTPSLAVCKADLKKWSAESADTWTIDQIYEQMTTMVACAEVSKNEEKKYKKVMVYLAEFYRTRAELGTRALNFIKGHELSDQFHEEQNGVSPAQSAQKKDDEKR